MSRKTIDEFPDLYNIYPPPPTTNPQNDDSRAQDLIDGRLSDAKVVPAYKVPWDGTHLENATPDLCDAIWGINEGKRDVRGLKKENK
jgi:hypothetical protein